MNSNKELENTPKEFDGNLTKNQVEELTQELIGVTSQNPATTPKNINTNREMEMLQSYNTLGTSEGAILEFTSSRRTPSLNKARSTYTDALEAIEHELEMFHENNFHLSSTGELPNTTLNIHYKKLRAREQALIISCTDLTQIISNMGLSEERTKLVNEVRGIQSQITNIKLMYREFVSATPSLIDDEEEIVQPAAKSDQQESQQTKLDTHQPGSSSIQMSAPSQNLLPTTTMWNSVVTTPGSLPNNTNYINTTTTTNVVRGSISAPGIQTMVNPHKHVTVCASPFCFGNTVNNTQNGIPVNIQHLPNQTPVVQRPLGTGQALQTESREYQALPQQGFTNENVVSREKIPVERQIEILTASIKDIVKMEMISVRQTIQQDNLQMMADFAQRLDKKQLIQAPLHPLTPGGPPHLQQFTNFNQQKARNYQTQSHDQNLDMNKTSSSEENEEASPDQTSQWKQHQAFRKLSETKDNQFDGYNPLLYPTWKRTIIKEGDQLKLDCTQWIRLLEAKTTGLAKTMVKDKFDIELELGAEPPLKAIWQVLDRRFKTHTRPSQKLLQ